MSTGYGREGIKAGMCDAARCAPYLSVSVVAGSTWGAITSVRPFTVTAYTHAKTPVQTLDASKDRVEMDGRTGGRTLYLLG